MFKKVLIILVLIFCLLQISITKTDCQESSISNSAEIVQNIYFTKKGKVKKYVDAANKSITKPELTQEEKNLFEPYIKNSLHNIKNVNQILKDNCYLINNREQKKYQQKLCLSQGNYVILNPGADFFAEYNTNDDIVGLIKMEKIVSTKNNLVQVFYEYEISDDKTEMNLRYILFIKIKDKEYFSQYVFNNSGDLLCKQIGNDIYIAEGSEILVPNWSKKLLNNHLASTSNFVKKSNLKKNISKTLFWIASPILLPVFIFTFFYGH